jgi:hypothetical protein
MTALAGAEAMILALRVGFAVSLYLFLTVAILALRHSLGGAAVPVKAGARLVLIRVGSTGDEAGRTVRLVGASVTIGRAPTNDIVVRDDGVSARHARLDADGDRWILSDVGSRNGTTVNGNPVAASVRLTHNDEIVTGDLTWRYDASFSIGGVA